MLSSGLVNSSGHIVNIAREKKPVLNYFPHSLLVMPRLRFLLHVAAVARPLLNSE